MKFNHSAFESLCAKETFQHRDFDGAHNLPILATSTFVYEDYLKARDYFAGNHTEKMNIYSRWANPTVIALEEKLAAIEAFDSGEEAYCHFFSSGMAAISATIMAFLSCGDRLLTQGNLYGTTTELFQTTILRQGIELLEIDCSDLNRVEESIKEFQPKLIYLESPSNPTMACVDMQKICTLAKQYGCLVVVDNTFNTAYSQQPLRLGADVVVYSTTKFLNGHGNALGGAVITNQEQLIASVWSIRKTIGAAASAFDAWLTYNGLKTLPLRMRKHIDNASKIADFLATKSTVQRVNYLGLTNHPSHELAKRQMHNFGSMLSFELAGGYDAGVHLIESLEMLTLTSSLGTTDTLITHPASTTHYVVPKEQREQYGISDGLIRLSVGLEGAEDIISDLDRGL